MPPVLVSHNNPPHQCPFVAFHSCWTCFLSARLFLKACSQPWSEIWSNSKSFLPYQSQRDFSLFRFFFCPKANIPKLPSTSSNLLSQMHLMDKQTSTCACSHNALFLCFFYLPGCFVVRSALHRTVSTSELNKISLMLGPRSDLKLLCSSVYLARLCGNRCYGCLVLPPGSLGDNVFSVPN